MCTPLNKPVETKYFKFKILAMPKSQCKINVAQIPKSMKAGDKGAVSIAMTMGSTTNSCDTMKGFIKKCDIDNKLWDKSNVSRTGGCEVHVATNGGTCATYCKSQGQMCMRA